MSAAPPKPICRTFLVCRELYQDNQTGEVIIVGPATEATAAHYPSNFTLNLFAHITSMRGTYLPALQLRDLDGRVVWGQSMGAPAEVHDALAVFRFLFRPVLLTVPRPGVFEIVLLLNDEEIVTLPMNFKAPG